MVLFLLITPLLNTPGYHLNTNSVLVPAYAKRHSALMIPPRQQMRNQAHLIAGGAAGLQPLSVVPAAVDLPILVEVDEVHQQLLAHAADEAGGVPAHAVTRPRGEHRDVAAVYLASALEGEKEGGL